MKVENFINSRGNKVKNQFCVLDNDVIYFQSYNSIIAKKDLRHDRKGKYITLDKNYWNYSRTTSKYRNIFLNETTKETEAKIKNGTYALADLNK